MLKYCDKRKTEMCIVKFELNSIVVNSKQQTSLGLYWTFFQHKNSTTKYKHLILCHLLLLTQHMILDINYMKIFQKYFNTVSYSMLSYYCKFNKTRAKDRTTQTDCNRKYLPISFTSDILKTCFKRCDLLDSTLDKFAAWKYLI